MDWPSEQGGLKMADFERVFRYHPQATTVVNLLAKDRGPVVWSHKTAEDWRSWLQDYPPSVHKDSGLVLIFARKPGEPQSDIGKLASREPDSSYIKSPSGLQGTFNEKDRSLSWPKNETVLNHDVQSGKLHFDIDNSLKGGGREVRRLPFDEITFKDICERFFVQSSISRVISRADVPLFSKSRVSVNIGESDSTSYPATVYHCRSSNTWADDMALTATYFPHSRLTFAILFGCTADVEKNIFNRLSRAKDRVYHPMILPGIFAEIEKDRMAKVVERTVSDIEGAIFELGTGNPVEGDTVQEEDKIDMRHSRRTSWLNTTYLRNSLRAWKSQLRKMADHVGEPLNFEGTTLGGNLSGALDGEPLTTQTDNGIARTSEMIMDRLHALIEEFEDRIQDCTMSVEGMTIATQWAQGDTNVDIATATGNDSRQMRSISLVTMIFLPGTFFATLFSMTFFDWSPNGDQQSVVSGYIWIYFLVTGVFTASTLVVWWYFLSPRRKKYRGCSLFTSILAV
ncbi:protein kinase [Colletotrichum scovillei]|uniref:Protein kinase n=2 Tax=Colletotrichum scovillei TaxID=1209932 RepID=A0A9P7RHE8_9PEZI|nr:protein kinase [Colletotrichum scovillei]KAG7082638.1 protein kinase [Colletotrichum scovillei]